MDSVLSARPATDDSVPESRFGVWFLGTETWETHVLKRALADLDRLIPARRASYPLILDIGCGRGRAFARLVERYSPARLIGVDVDSAMLDLARAEAERQPVPIELRCESVARLGLPDQSVDLVFCHQTFHHLADQERSISQLHRVLKPGGLLLFAESARVFIDSWIIRVLFRHPMSAQKSAREYLAMVRAAGFAVAPAAVSYPNLWWSRPDLGMGEHWFGITPADPKEETLINLVGVRR